MSDELVDGVATVVENVLLPEENKTENVPAVVEDKPLDVKQPNQGFQLKVPIEELRKRSIFLAMPCFGGMMSGMCARALMDLSALCTHYGIALQAYFLFNESLITRARNYCADEFVRSTATHMFFLDADIGFNPNDVIALLAMASEDSPYDIIGAPYPKKCISWEKIKLAVDKGFADENPNNLDKYVGDYVFNPKQGNGSIPIGEPAEVAEIGTGFMMVKKSVFTRFEKAHPEYYYRPDHVRTEAFDGTREIMQYFQAEIDPKSRRYLSEDYWFSYKCQDLGIKTWLCPWMQLQHVGTYVFGGSLADLAMIGASATADSALLEKGKNRNKK